MDQDQLKRVSFFHNHIYSSTFMWVAPIIVLLVYLLCAVVVVNARKPTTSSTKAAWEPAILIIGAWTLIPPLWFLIDYNYLVPMRPPERLPDIEAFKHFQDLARNFWLAAVALLVMLYSGKSS